LITDFGSAVVIGMENRENVAAGLARPDKFGITIQYAAPEVNIVRCD
jgi:hypothetical protein